MTVASGPGTLDRTLRRRGSDVAPFVTIIVPCRNERGFIEKCLESIVTNDYPADRLEVLVVDGMSTDGTRNVVEDHARQHAFIRLLNNPRQITPCALNTAIREACGEFVLWMSAHNAYERTYVRRCVEAALEFGADNVGGIIVAVQRDRSFVGRCVLRAISHPFGVGNSFFRIRPSGPRWVDTVFGGCYRRDVFEKVGLFNERLFRGQDMEFNLRLRKAGGRTLLIPDVISYYYARSEFGAFWRHNWSNGVWAVLPFAYSKVVPVSWRHLVPLSFVASLVGSTLLGLVWTSFWWLGVAIVAGYGLASVIASLGIAWRERDARYAAVMPFVFGMLHVGYGLGSLWGVVKVLMTVWRTPKS